MIMERRVSGVGEMAGGRTHCRRLFKSSAPSNLFVQLGVCHTATSRNLGKDQLMYCPQCAAPIDGLKFCRSCGTNVSLVSQAITGRLPESRADESPSPARVLRRLYGGVSLARGLRRLFVGVSFI